MHGPISLQSQAFKKNDLWFLRDVRTAMGDCFAALLQQNVFKPLALYGGVNAVVEMGGTVAHYHPQNQFQITTEPTPLLFEKITSTGPCSSW